ncbi:MAG: hypothetical protein LUQ17_00385 [Methanomicrobiales archaeon]|nr:hypothetical protein [Methanomicrobiales archaeon]
MTTKSIAPAAKREGIGKKRLSPDHRHYPDHCRYRLNESGCLTHKKNFCSRIAHLFVRAEKLRDLQENSGSDTEGQRDGARKSGGRKTAGRSSECDTDRKTFGNVMEGDGKSKQGTLAVIGGGPVM